MGNIKLQIDNSNIMASIERASLSITSPSGKTIYIYKKHLSLFNEKQRELFWEFCNDPMIRFQGFMEASREDMQGLLELSKIRQTQNQ